MYVIRNTIRGITLLIQSEFQIILDYIWITSKSNIENIATWLLQAFFLTTYFQCKYNAFSIFKLGRSNHSYN